MLPGSWEKCLEREREREPASQPERESVPGLCKVPTASFLAAIWNRLVDDLIPSDHPLVSLLFFASGRCPGLASTTRD